MQYILDTVYPIGSIYITVNPHGSPAKIFGGTWERLDDTFLVGAGNLYDVGDTGGSANAKLIRHTHNAVAVGNHSHDAELYGKYYMRDSDKGSGKWGAEAYNFESFDTWSEDGSVKVSGTTKSAGSHTHTIDPTGDVNDGINENLPPYTAVFIYKRIPDNGNTGDVELY